MGDFQAHLRQSIWETLAYADVFAYPLTVDEVHRYLIGLPASIELVERALLDYPHLYEQRDGLYALPGRSEITIVRQRRARVAALLWPYARRYGQAIARLPFVRMVAVTGSLAVNNVEENADIDYLIVTEPGHLWLTRAMVLFLGRLSSRHGIGICPNYLITLRSLTFSDQSLYSAHELVQMVPLAGLDVYSEIRRQNAWTQRYLPNAGFAPEGAGNEPASQVKPSLEALLSLPPFAWIETWEMERKIHRLSREQQTSAESSFSADVCKGHDQRHQARTYDALGQRQQMLEPGTPGSS